MKLTVFIACFNEKSTILPTIAAAKQLNVDKEIMVIDNCSTDGTREILEGLAGDKDLRIILHPKNMGSGYSACECIKLAQGDCLYGPGADLEYRMEDVYSMIDKMEKENLDVVFGSRLLARKNVSKAALIKERPFWLGTIISTALVNLFYRRKFTDIIASKLMKIGILKSLNMEVNNQAFEFELVSRLCKKGCKIGEVPVYYKPRTHKEGKTIRVIDMLPALLAMFKVKFFVRKG
jgi:glycosyltransferase involved in cell wall biosynthesis